MAFVLQTFSESVSVTILVYAYAKRSIIKIKIWRNLSFVILIATQNFILAFMNCKCVAASNFLVDKILNLSHVNDVLSHTP